MLISFPSLSLYSATAGLGRRASGAGQPFEIISEVTTLADANYLEYGSLVEGEFYHFSIEFAPTQQASPVLVLIQLVSNGTILTQAVDGSSYRMEGLYNHAAYTTLYVLDPNFGYGAAHTSNSDSLKMSANISLYLGEDAVSLSTNTASPNADAEMHGGFRITRKNSSADAIRIGYGTGNVQFLTDGVKTGTKITMYRMGVAS